MLVFIKKKPSVTIVYKPPQSSRLKPIYNIFFVLNSIQLLCYVLTCLLNYYFRKEKKKTKKLFRNSMQSDEKQKKKKKNANKLQTLFIVANSFAVNNVVVC